MTSRKLGERDSALLRTYFDASSSGIFVYDASGALVDINRTACLMHGRPREAMLASDPRDFIAPESHAVFERFLETLQAGETFHGEAIGLRDDGSRFHAEVDGRLINMNGERLFFSSVIDISERKRLEDQLLQQQRMDAIGQLAAGIAHDFNNILTVIQGHAALATEQASDPAVEEDLEAITAAAQRAGRLTQYLLAFSRQQALSMETVDLCELVRKHARLLTRIFPENIRIILEQTAEACYVNADPTQLEQVLMNLCLNAKQAMPRGGTLRLLVELEQDSPRTLDTDSTDSTASGSRHWLLRVIDDGMGMDEATQAMIFEPFFTTKSRGLGTGLGLAMVHGVVRQHGGRVDVESTPGDGTEFIIRLPRAQPVCDNVTADYKEELSGRGERILIVEDDEDVSAVLRRMLTRLGYVVGSAASGKEALESLLQERPALALIDLMLPDEVGPEVLHSLRKHDPGLKAIFMSGYAGDEIRQRAIEYGDVRLLQKPVKASDLAAEMRAALDDTSSGVGYSAVSASRSE